MASYPHAPGWKDPTVSRENAVRIKGRAAMLRWRLVALFDGGFIGSADEAAMALGEPVLSIRPRCTELLQAGKLERVRIERNMRGRYGRQLTARWLLRRKENMP